jgi:hypothetical protein
MFKNLFKTIWGHLNQNKAYAAINIGGLADIAARRNPVEAFRYE